MKSRTCPNCGYRYSFLEYFKSVAFKSTYSVWNCKNCNSRLTVDSGRRMTGVILTVLPATFGPVISKGLQQMDFSSLVSWILILFVLIIWILWISAFDLFKLPKK